MKERIFFKNILLILITFLILFMFFIPKSYATLNYFGKQFPDFPDGWDNADYKIIVYYFNQDKYQLFFWNEDNSNPYYNKFCTERVSPSNVLNYLSIPKGYSRFEWNPSTNSNDWIEIFTSGSENEKSLSFYSWKGYVDDSTSSAKQMIYSNYNIPFDVGNDYFFYKTPLLNSSNMQLTVGGNIYQSAIVLIITILVAVVFLVGFRKGWNLLVQTLHKV